MYRRSLMQPLWIALTILFGLGLDIIPLPPMLSIFQPQWTVLILCYWLISIPERINLGTAWFVGLLVDALQGSVLGLHAFALSFVAYVVVKVYRMVRVYPLWQQSLSLLPVIFSYELLLWFCNYVLNQRPNNHWFGISTVVSVILWPGIYLLLVHWQSRFRIE